MALAGAEMLAAALGKGDDRLHYRAAAWLKGQRERAHLACVCPRLRG